VLRRQTPKHTPGGHWPEKYRCYMSDNTRAAGLLGAVFVYELRTVETVRMDEGEETSILRVLFTSSFTAALVFRLLSRLRVRCIRNVVIFQTPCGKSLLRRSWRGGYFFFLRIYIYNNEIIDTAGTVSRARNTTDHLLSMTAAPTGKRVHKIPAVHESRPSVCVIYRLPCVTRITQKCSSVFLVPCVRL